MPTPKTRPQPLPAAATRQRQQPDSAPVAGHRWNRRASSAPNAEQNKTRSQTWLRLFMADIIYGPSEKSATQARSASEGEFAAKIGPRLRFGLVWEAGP